MKWLGQNEVPPSSAPPSPTSYAAPHLPGCQFDLDKGYGSDFMLISQALCTVTVATVITATVRVLIQSPHVMG